MAAICHAPWTLVEAGVVEGRTLTSWPSLQTDIRNAGGEWVDEEVHVDSGLVTSRKPDDLDAFCAKMIEEIAEGVHAEQREATVGLTERRARRRSSGGRAAGERRDGLVAGVEQADGLVDPGELEQPAHVGVRAADAEARGRPRTAGAWSRPAG